MNEKNILHKVTKHSTCLKAFATGSRVYGRPKPDSDYDIVLWVTEEEKQQLISASESDDGLTIRFGPINIIAVTNATDYYHWMDAKDCCRRNCPVTREEAIEIHKLENITDEEYPL